MSKEPITTVGFDPNDYRWHAYCHGCPDENGGHLSVAIAHTADGVRLTQLVQAAIKHRVEVHG